MSLHLTFGTVLISVYAAVSSGALIQFRALGGVLGLSITTTAFNSYIKTDLVDFFGSITMRELLVRIRDIENLSLDDQVKIRTVLSKAYGVQSKILVAFAALQILVVTMVYRKDGQVRLQDENVD